jgi:hypothetical protein
VSLLVIPVQSLTCGHSDKTTLSYAAIFNIKKGLKLGANEYVGNIRLLRLYLALILTLPELALVPVLFWMGWMGLADESIDAKVSSRKISRG